MAWSTRNGNYWQAGVTLTKVSETSTSIKLKYTALFRSDYAIELYSSINYTMKMTGAYSWTPSTYDIDNWNSYKGTSGKWIKSENDTSVTLYTKEFTVTKTTSTQTVTASNTVKVSAQSSGTKTATVSYTVPALAKYTVSYNANNGTGAPSSQTKYYGKTLTLSSTKPTRKGYTFAGWGTTSTDTTVNYKAGGSYTSNASITLYAIWTEHKLTISYYSNNATATHFDGALNTVGSGKNVKVYELSYLYDNSYSTNGLPNYSGSNGAAYMTRTGYSPTCNWGTTTSGGTLIHEDKSFASGQAIAQALGKDLTSGNASINLYAQWSENKLTVNFHSNYADYGAYAGEKIEGVAAGKDAIAYTKEYLYDNAYSDGLSNIQNSEYLYLSRTGYRPTGNWGTATSGGTLVSQSTSFASGQAVAEIFGKSLETGNATVDVYVQWNPNNYTLTLDANGGIPDITTLTLTYDAGYHYEIGSSTPVKLGYKFLGWYTAANDGVMVYDEEGICINDDIYWKDNKYVYPDDLTLYAQWKPSAVVYIDNGVSFEPYFVYIDNGTDWDLYIAYIDNGTDWEIVS